MGAREGAWKDEKEKRGVIDSREEMESSSEAVVEK